MSCVTFVTIRLIAVKSQAVFGRCFHMKKRSGSVDEIMDLKQTAISLSICRLVKTS